MRIPFIQSCGLALALALFPPSARAQDDLGVIVPPSEAGLTGTPQIKRDPTDASIAAVTAELVQRWQFSQHPFDAEISSKFLDRYLEALDYFHLLFLQSDLKEFESYRSNLQDYVMEKKDISPAYDIFARFLLRANQREAFETNLLHTEKFDFSGHERFTMDRHDLPNPKDMTEAANLWREEVRLDYLDEKLREKIVFAGPVTFDAHSNLVITLSSNALNSTRFDFLPGKFLDDKGRQIGWVETPGNLADATNATVHLEIQTAANLLKITNHFFTADGTNLGTITFTRAPDPATPIVQADASSSITTPANVEGAGNNLAFTNNEAVARAKISGKEYRAEIHFDQKDTANIVRTLQKRYAQIVKNYNQLTNDGHVLEYYLTSLARAYDPHSDYFGRAQAENFDIQMRLSLVGIGAQLHQMESDECEIEDLIPDGPAEKSGQITNHDIILAVAQKDQDPVPVTGMPLQDVVDMIRGPKDTPVTLTIQKYHSTRQKLVTLIRAKVQLVDKEAKAELYDTTPKIGVINVPSFYAANDSDGPGSSSHDRKSVTTDVAKLVSRLKKENVEGIILDFRANGGGYLDQAEKLTGLFIGKGPVDQTKGPDGEIRTGSSTASKPLYDGPLMVLTSRMSASASEILAGALQDYGRALIVGDKTTFGKGTVQTVEPLEPFMEEKHLPLSPNLGRLHVTIKKFYRASGLTTESNGVAADIVLPSLLNYANFSESSQPNWLPADTVTPANNFPRDYYFGMVQPYLTELLKRTQERQDKSKDFDYLQEDIDQYRKSLKDKSISMNEADRLAEQHTNEARLEARNKERASRPKKDEKVFDITLKNVGDDNLEARKLAPKPPPEDGADPAEADEAPDDPDWSILRLAEARHIMADYIALLKTPLAADKSPAAGPTHVN
jgi:carboxyl-terminal processing protease